jgi:hypothetical protein
VTAKATNRRERKPETLAFLRRAWRGELCELEIPPAFRGSSRHGYKFFAAALEYHADRLTWACRNQQHRDYAILQRVRAELLAAHWVPDALESDKVRYAVEYADLRRFLEEHRSWWSRDRQRYEVSIAVAEKVKALLAEPTFARFVRAARAQIEEDRDRRPRRAWQRGDLRWRERQQRGELGAGNQPLETRVRKLVHKARRRGEFSLVGPVTAVTEPEYGPPWASVRDPPSSTNSAP